MEGTRRSTGRLVDEKQLWHKPWPEKSEYSNPFRQQMFCELRRAGAARYGLVQMESGHRSLWTATRACVTAPWQLQLLGRWPSTCWGTSSSQFVGATRTHQPGKAKGSPRDIGTLKLLSMADVVAGLRKGVTHGAGSRTCSYCQIRLLLRNFISIVI